jgi:hypothetical protein
MTLCCTMMEIALSTQYLALRHGLVLVLPVQANLLNLPKLST